MSAVLNYMAIPGVPRGTNRERSKLFRVFDPEIIIKTGCEYFKIDMSVMQRKCRKREIVFPRQVIMYFLSEYTDMTYLLIGSSFYKDHTTVIHSKDTIKDLMTTDDKVRAKVEELKNLISNNH
jgi:chromosomal replication initiator protein